MNKYIAVLIMFFLLFIGAIFLFKNTGERIKENESETIINTKSESNYTQDSENSFAFNNSSKDKIVFNTLDKPRDDAASHNMDEQYFADMSLSDYGYMDENIKERMSSLANAKVKARKRHRVNDQNEDE